MQGFQRDSKGRIIVTLISGDGIGREVSRAVRRVLDAAGAPLAFEECVAGAEAFKAGDPTGVPPETLASLRRNRLALKGPLETPVGFGEKSANVTLRKLFETYGNVRPVRELPGVKTPFSGRGVDLVIVRENVEDLYAGIEHQQTPSVAQCLKIVSRQGCEKIVRLAFELARAEGRQRVTCATKANIMKLTEGLMKRTFEEIAPEYPELRADHLLVDDCAHKLVKAPEQFGVIVTTNMNGDILSDLASALVGGLGVAPSANIGRDCAIFEAVHGSAPDIAGKDVANPTALLLSAVMLLRHVGEGAIAARVKDALLATLEDGRLTGDLAGGKGLSTSAFTEEIVARLGRHASRERARVTHAAPRLPTGPSPVAAVRPASRELAGVDLFVEADDTAQAVGDRLAALAEGTRLQLKIVSNRGTRVWPDNGASTDCVDHWRCRFVSRSGPVDDQDLVGLLQKASAAGVRWMHVEKLQRFDGVAAWTKAQGES